MKGPCITGTLFGAALPIVSSTVFAHDSAAGLAGGFGSGFVHPVCGWDHVVAMVAVGLWGAFLGHPALWMLPIVFPLIMAFGGSLARFSAGEIVVRGAGGCIALVGVAFLVGQI